MRSLAKMYEGRPFELLGVNTDEQGGEQSLAERAEELDLPMRSLMDGSTSGPATRAWGVRAFPTQFLIDHKGIIRGIDLSPFELAKEINRLLDLAEADAETK